MDGIENHMSAGRGRRGGARGCILLVFIVACGLGGWLLYSRKKAGPGQETPQYIVSARRAEAVTCEAPPSAEGMPPGQRTFSSPDRIEYVLLVLRFEHLPDSLLDEQGELRLADCFLMARGQRRDVRASSFYRTRRESPVPGEEVRREIGGWFLFSVPRDALEMTLHADDLPPIPFSVGPAILRELHVGEHTDSPFL